MIEPVSDETISDGLRYAIEVQIFATELGQSIEFDTESDYLLGYWAQQTGVRCPSRGLSLSFKQGWQDSQDD